MRDRPWRRSEAESEAENEKRPADEEFSAASDATEKKWFLNGSRGFIADGAIPVI